jgi:hypothetical protein
MEANAQQELSAAQQSIRSGYQQQDVAQAGQFLSLIA